MKRIIIISLAALMLLLVMAVSASAAGMERAVFRTPGDAAYCTYGLDYPPLQIVCWTPNDGFTVQMTLTGRSWKYYEPWNKGHYDHRVPILRFGHSKRLSYRSRNSVVCTSRSTGLTCVNSRRHGWWLGRYVGYRLF